MKQRFPSQKTRTPATGLLVAAMGLMGSDFATAQDGAGRPQAALEEVIVSARRRDEAVQDVPIAMTALNGEQLAEQAVVTISDLQYRVPGLQMSPSSRGSATPSVAIRGQVQRDVNPSADSAVGFYFAEVPIARPNGINGSLFDIQAVEVLKGPQGTLFGRNTTGGAVLITPNTPATTLSGMAQITAGNYDLIDVEGMANLPLTDVAQLRVAGKTTRRDGYMKDVSPGTGGHRANDVDNQSYRASLALQPMDDVDSIFIATYFNAQDGGTANRLTAFNPAGYPIAALRGAATTAAQDALARGKYEYQTLPYVDVTGKRYNLYSETTTKSFQNTTTWNLSDRLTLKNIASWRNAQASGLFNIGGLPIPTVQTNADTDMDQITEELQIQGDLDDLNWVVGAFYFYEDGNDASPGNQFTTATEIFTSNAYIRNISKSLFAHADYVFADDWTLSAGVRWNDDQRTTRVHNRSPISGSRTTYRCFDGSIVTNSLGGEACPENTGSAHFEKPTYELTLAYQASSDALVYLSHRRGYRSGAVFSRPPTLAALSEPTEPEIVSDFELGLKSEFGSDDVRARANVAVFQSNYTDAQRLVTQLDSNGVLGSNLVNAGKATIRGAEADFSVALGSSWTIDASASYLDANYDTFEDRTAAGLVVDVSDSDFVLAPSYVYTVGIAYALPLAAELGEANLRADWYKQDDFESTEINTNNCGPGGAYTGCINNPYSTLSGYALLNLRADWRSVMSTNFDVGLFVTNALDEHYYSSGNALMNNLGVTSATVGAPRMYGAQVRYHFE